MKIKLLCWNMEWMNDLFDGDGNFHPDDYIPFHSKNTTVKERREHLSGVINEIAPEVVVVVEGPNRTRELKLFFDSDVQGNWESYIQHTKSSAQSIGIAVRTDTGKFDAQKPIKNFDTNNIAAFNDFQLDSEDDGITELYRYERKPVYSEINLSNGEKFRVLGIHLKSKGIFDLLDWSKFWEKSHANRRRILATAYHLRTAFVEPYLDHQETSRIPLIVCGDVNDGPGFDPSERKILGSGIERLMGDIWRPQYVLGNAIYDTYQDLKVNTTRFADPIFNFNYKYHYVWLDHILYTRNRFGYISNGIIHKDMNHGKIWKIYPHASDHQPISCDIELIPEG